MYKFSLEPVLNYRKNKERKIQQELVQLRDSLMEETKRLLHAIKREKKYLRELLGKQKEGVTISEALIYYDFIKRLSREIEAQKKVVEELEKKLVSKRETLIKACQDRKILERLKEKGKKELEKRIEKKEQSFLDEIGTNSFIRNSSQI